jgi:hypothetical protein
MLHLPEGEGSSFCGEFFMKLIGEKASTHSGEFKTITIRWPADTQMPVVHGKWQRLTDGRIQAVYDPLEFSICKSLLELLRDLNTFHRK